MELAVGWRRVRRIITQFSQIYSIITYKDNKTKTNYELGANKKEGNTAGLRVMGASSRVAGAIWSDLLEAEADKKEEAGFVAAGETMVAAAVVVLLAEGESLDRRQPLRHGDRSLHSQTRSPQSQQKRVVTAFCR
ncbi:unnamed protein product [Linum trigynum]|uniref:Uncharacterized protein n=1 Tax=Linum trigynum TaxID=586398 RepID=A0AAV2D6F5_9ROSI